MGVRASLTEISPDAFKQIASGGEPELRDGKRTSLDKAWYDYYAMTGYGAAPLKKAITGDCLHPQSTQTLEQFYAGAHDYYAGFASPRFVLELANALSGLTYPDLKQTFAENDRELRDYDWNAFQALQSAYVEAATAGNGLMILIG